MTEFPLDCGGLLNQVYLKPELCFQPPQAERKKRQKRWGLDKQREGRDSKEVED